MAHALLAPAVHQSGRARDAQRVADGVLGQVDREGDVADAQLVGGEQRGEDPDTERVDGQAERRPDELRLGVRYATVPRGVDPLGTDR